MSFEYKSDPMFTIESGQSSPDDDILMVSDGVYSVLLAEQNEAKQAHYALRYEVYAEERGWLDKNSDRAERDAYDDLPDTMHFLVRHDESGLIIGAFRIIHMDDPRELPSARLSGQGHLIPPAALSSTKAYNRSEMLERIRMQISENWPILREHPPVSLCFELSRVCLSKKRLQDANKVIGRRITHSPFPIMCTTPFFIAEISGLDPNAFLMSYITAKEINQKLKQCGLKPFVTGPEFEFHGQKTFNLCNMGESAPSIKASNGFLGRAWEANKQGFNESVDVAGLCQNDPILQAVFSHMGIGIKGDTIIAMNPEDGQSYISKGTDSDGGRSKWTPI